MNIDDLHLKPYDEALELLARLCAEGTPVRIETPDLTWIWHTQYPAPTIHACFHVNRLFRESTFLYNFGTLEATLLHAGYGRVARAPSIPGTLIVEAEGTGGRAPEYLAEPMSFYLRDLNIR